MAQAQKLEALVRKAAAQGWIYPGKGIGLDLDHMTFSDKRMAWTCDDYWPWQELLFNHDFARALFGEGTAIGAVDGEQKTFWAAWKLHLMRAVISDDPIDYMYKAVFESN